MIGLMKSVLIIGRVLNLLIGDDFNTPAAEVMERFPYLHFGM